MATTATILSHRWFPAAHLDYYVAHPRGYNLLAIGDLERIHKYAWIDRERRGLHLDSDAYFITSSRDFQDPEPLFGKYFKFIEQPEVIKIFKGSKNVENFFVYRLRFCNHLPPDVLDKFGIAKSDKSILFDVKTKIDATINLPQDSLPDFFH
jgi:hypothetical protein